MEMYYMQDVCLAWWDIEEAEVPSDQVVLQHLVYHLSQDVHPTRPPPFLPDYTEVWD